MNTPNLLDLLIHAPAAVVDGRRQAVSVGVRAGRIVSVDPLGTGAAARTVIELAPDEVLLPGLVDTHVHVNEPGRTEWEGFASATRAAAAGGVTTLIDMPLNSIPPTVDPAALATKRQVAQGQCFIDVGFWGGAVPGNTAALRPLAEAGVFGYKCFLLHSGVDEFPALSIDEVERDMAEIAAFDGLLIVHAEDAHLIDTAPPASGPSYRRFLSSRPDQAELTAIEQVIEAARRTGVRVHLLHLATAQALPTIRRAKADGVRLTVETCPHYLSFDAEDIPDGATQYKCCPPIRDRDNRELLWQGLIDGTIDLVVSDHSPSTADLKCFDTGDFGTAWGGIASVQLGLSAVWTQGRQRGAALEQVVEWMSTRPADLVGLAAKGRIAVGAAADFAVFAPDDCLVVDPNRLHHKVPLSAYADRRLDGVVRRTILAGRDITDTVAAGAEPSGRLLTAKEAD